MHSKFVPCNVIAGLVHFDQGLLIILMFQNKTVFQNRQKSTDQLRYCRYTHYVIREICLDL